VAYVDNLLGQDEQVLYVARQHALVLASRILTGLALIALLVSAGMVAQRAWGDYHTISFLGTTLAINGQQILLIMFLISLLVLVSIFISFLRWNAESFVITDRRVLQIRGIMSKMVTDFSLGKISDVALSQTVLGRMFNFGTIEILTATDDGTGTMEGINAPLAFKEAMLDARRNYERGYGYLEPHWSDVDSNDTMPAEFEIHRALEELARLRDRGILSAEEFEHKKRELLNRV
jgi:uncharacterized membrane protein YdbT with pleckstrin-like domain